MSYRIYLVEDHPSMRDAYMLVLSAEPDLEICGMTATAENALADIAQAAPDLVLVDVSLPGMNGFEFLAQLYQQQPAISALIISGHDKALHHNRTPPNAKGYVMKQEGPEALVAAIREILDKPG